MILAVETTMLQIILTLIISFAAFVIIALFLNYCRRRLRKTPHGLTGMCHRNGGTMCSSCQDQTRKKSSNP